MQKEEKILKRLITFSYLLKTSPFCLIEFFLDSKHTELLERNYIYWGNDDLHT